MLARLPQEQAIGLVELLTVELCVLGGPVHSYFDEVSAQTWLTLPDRNRSKLMQTYTETLVNRGLLLPEPTNGDAAGSSSYALSTELGVVLAARCRPSFIVATDIAGAKLRQPVIFALGDEQDPAQAMVTETPVLLDVDSKTKKQLGPLTQGSAYVLSTRKFTADYLADWMIRPVPNRPGVPRDAARVISLYRPVDDRGKAGYRLSVRGDGTTANIDLGTGLPPRQCGHDELRTVMADLLDGKLG